MLVKWLFKAVQKTRRGVEYLFARTPGVRLLYWQFIPGIYRWSRTRTLEYDAPLDPVRIRWIDPQDICRFTGRGEGIYNRWQSVGVVRDGNWDRGSPRRPKGKKATFLENVFSANQFEETVLYKSFQEHFINDKKWQDTEFFQRLLQTIENGCPVWRDSKSKEDLLERCQNIDRIYDDIKINGYKTQFEIIKDTRLKSNQVGFLDILTDEICIDIGRNGELLFVDGRHRLAIAKLLGLEKIPVTILVRHEKWMKERDKIYNELSKDRLLHPDMVEI